MSCLRQPTAGQLRYQMNGVADIVCAPDRSVNAVVERVPATLLHEESWWAVEIKWYERVPDATLTVHLRLRAGGPQASSSVATTAPPYKYKRLPLHS